MKHMKVQWGLQGTGLALSMAMALATGPADAQQVYRCEQASGGVIFSDRPCRSDVGREQRIDATPHQGHRAISTPAVPELRSQARPVSTAQRAPVSDRPLPRNERLTLERRRAELLSGLKRRHVKPDHRRAMIGELRGVDRQLGIGPADVADMPFHNREIYEDNQVFRRTDR